ncbi:sulfur carrier protein ThiS [Paenibacillus sp. 19GGS1-52]|uniref:sulfur carrier protein ThiS n=1 Tax=Paenibacillus sp. 19GGS1-52 TaxID=2758563 RepID=UPI001EFB43A2|nr:sulfur carrier protein ThiS [Paenibacillus sp. 19GGS1-52]ULO05858.1 sulfur carrier protein ThiS [Paenibacillus sp. 19GGS1-52]
MKLWINGTASEYSEDYRTMTELLSRSEWSGRLIIVELNGAIISREEYGNVCLNDGDRIELVHFVGGG